MRASIIIPTLNAPGIQQAVASVLDQTPPAGGLEVIVIGRDDPGIIQPNDRLTFLDTAHPTPPAAARNAGAVRAQGELLCFMDADCEAAPDWIAVIDAAFADPELTILGGGVAFDPGPYWTLADNIASFYPYLTSSTPGPREILPSLNLALRHSVWRAVGGFDERYPFPAAEDSDWSLRARRAGHTLYFDPRAVVWHRPVRSTAADLWRHAVRFGSYSVKIDPRYDAFQRRPLVLRHWLPLLAAAPTLAAIVSARAYTQPGLWPFLPALPAVYLAKLGWCWGAAQTLRRGGPVPS